jgi:hypothetical protein
MMDDQELLELAAKANNSPNIKLENFGAWFDDERERYWNPLVNDGDALRLAVKLKLAIFPPEGDDGDFAVASVPEGVLDDFGETWFQENVKDGDELAATRRAIVCAAAEIGKAKINDLTPGDEK